MSAKGSGSTPVADWFATVPATFSVVTTAE